MNHFKWLATNSTGGGPDEDDVYNQFQCNDAILSDFGVQAYNGTGGNIFLGLSRVFSFFLVFAFNFYNKHLLAKKNDDSVNIVKGLVLPSYRVYIYIYICLSLLSGFLDLGVGIRGNREDANLYLIPIETGMFHCLFEGLAFFLMRYGSGVRAILRSLQWGAVWGAIVAVMYYFLLSALDGNRDDANNPLRVGYSIFMSIVCTSIIFYSSFLVVPVTVMYRRPALEFYAKYNVFYYSFSIIFATLLYARKTDAYCACSVLLLLLSGIVEPLVIFRTLQIDSEFWQGLTSADSPVAEVWDSVGLDTAKSMGDNLEQFGRSTIKLPILHYGLLKFDEKMGYVAGGFSRVYFGKLKENKVAFKIVFAMELTPSDVQEFYDEAAILYNLKHENVISCQGISVMPPSLILVLEYCKYGSLFDFLYKPRKFDHSDYSLAMSMSKRESGLTHESFAQGTSIANLLSHPSVVGQMQATFTQQQIAQIGRSPLHSESAASSSSARPSNVTLTSVARKDGESFATATPSLPHNQRTTSYMSELLLDDKGMMTRDGGYGMEAGRVRLSSDISNSGSITRDHLSDVRLSEHFQLEEGRASGVSNNSGPDRSSSRWSASSNRFSTAIEKVASGVSKIFRKSLGGGAGSSMGNEPKMFPFATLISFEQRVRMMRDAANAIAYLHSKNYMHCDIKSLNFLVTEDLVVKLADMGEARLATSKPKRDIPPIPARNWAPPEVLAPKAPPESYTIESDVYGLSIVLSELLTLELPFGDTCELVSVEKWLAILKDGTRPALPNSLPAPLRGVLEQGWSTDPDDRPRAADILSVLDDIISTFPPSLSDVGLQGFHK